MTLHVDRSTPLSARAGLLSVATALLLTACSSAGQDEPPARAVASTAASASPSASAGPTTAATPTAVPAAPAVTITMVDFAYEVPPQVPAGSEVTVVNEDAEAHTFTLSGGAAVRLVVPPRGGSATFRTPASPGTYPVVCEFHGGMATSLVVV